MTEHKTWLEAIDSNGFDAWTRELMVREAQRTHFVAPIPDDLAFLRGGLATLGFDNLDLPPQEQNELLLAFVGRGVRVPGTPYRLRNWGLRSFVELADGGEDATLPEDWRQVLLMPTPNHEGFIWIGKRVPRSLVSGVEFSRYEEVGDGWVLRNDEPEPPTTIPL